MGLMTDMGVGFYGQGMFQWFWYSIEQDKSYVGPWWYWCAYTLMGLNGALNGMMYVMLSGPMLRQADRQQQPTRLPQPPATNSRVQVAHSTRQITDASWHVKFGESQTSLVSVLTCSSAATGESLLDTDSDDDSFLDQFWAGTSDHEIPN